MSERMNERKNEEESTLRSYDDATDGTIDSERRERKLQLVMCAKGDGAGRLVGS